MHPTIFRNVYFNSRPSARGDKKCRTNWQRIDDFNSRPSARGDCLKRCLKMRQGRFQFTPLREGRRIDANGFCHQLHFNSRPSARGDILPRAQFRRVLTFQFTPLREGRRNTKTNHGISPAISIHAPPRGATSGSWRECWSARISIHAPPRGATKSSRARPAEWRFQFTPLREGRRMPQASRRRRKPISIHAPPRGATGTSRNALRRVADFNSRPSARGDALTSATVSTDRISIHAPPRGATHSLFTKMHAPQFQFTPLREGRRTAALHAAIAALFQFTPLREGRLRTGHIVTPLDEFQFTPLREGRRRVRHLHTACRYFNSRPSARGDMRRAAQRASSLISIHAPPRGATGPAPNVANRHSISIHAPPRGATEWADFTGDFFRISIHAPPRGATTLKFRKEKNNEHISIHAPPRGATATRRGFLTPVLFQFTPLREGRPGRLETSRETAEFQFTPLREGRH